MNAMSDVSWNNVKRGYCARQIFEFNTMSCQPEYQKTRMCGLDEFDESLSLFCCGYMPMFKRHVLPTLWPLQIGFMMSDTLCKCSPQVGHSVNVCTKSIPTDKQGKLFLVIPYIPL